LDAQKPVTLTAIIACRPEAVAEVEAALVAVGRYVKANEPGTLDYRVIRADGDAPVYITHERFRDREASGSTTTAPARRASSPRPTACSATWRC